MTAELHTGLPFGLSLEAQLHLWVVFSIPALLRSNCVRITAVDLNKELAGFSRNSRSKD
jgi:hypothetical protein